jgi:hypothetical protein
MASTERIKRSVRDQVFEVEETTRRRVAQKKEEERELEPLRFPDET